MTQRNKRVWKGVEGRRMGARTGRSEGGRGREEGPTEEGRKARGGLWDGNKGGMSEEGRVGGWMGGWEKVLWEKYNISVVLYELWFWSGWHGGDGGGVLVVMGRSIVLCEMISDV